MTTSPTAATAATTATASTTSTISSTASVWGSLTAVPTTTAVVSGLASRVGTLEAAKYTEVIRLDPKQTDEQAFRLPWGKVASVSHEELIKYIGERELRESNELVRTLWDRYQTAVKLIWSEDDEQEK